MAFWISCDFQNWGFAPLDMSENGLKLFTSVSKLIAI
jgi:hypothetical protein